MDDEDTCYPDWAGDARMLIAVHSGSSPNHVLIQDTDMDEEISYFLVLIKMQPHKIAVPDMYFASFSGVHTLH